MPLIVFHKPDESNREEVNTMMDRNETVYGIHIPERTAGDSSCKSVFVSGLCQGLKNVNQYRSDMIEKIKDQLGSHSIDFRKKQ